MTIQVISHPTHRQKQRDGGVDCKFLFLSFLLLFCRVFAIFECKVLKSLKCVSNQIFFVCAPTRTFETFYCQSSVILSLFLVSSFSYRHLAFLPSCLFYSVSFTWFFFTLFQGILSKNISPGFFFFDQRISPAEILQHPTPGA